MNYARPYQRQFYLLTFLTLLVASLTPLTPLLIQITIDDYVAKNDYRGLLFMIAILFAVLVVQAIIQYFHTYLSGWLGQFVIRDIRGKLFNHLTRLRLKFFDNTPIGRLVTRAVSDIETLANVFNQGVAAIISDLLQIVTILGIMFFLNWKLTLIVLATLPLLIISTSIFKDKIKVSFNLVRNTVANLNSFVQEHITVMSII